jgi:hypothetical protein
MANWASKFSYIAVPNAVKSLLYMAFQQPSSALAMLFDFADVISVSAKTLKLQIRGERVMNHKCSSKKENNSYVVGLDAFRPVLSFDVLQLILKWNFDANGVLRAEKNFGSRRIFKA